MLNFRNHAAAVLCFMLVPPLVGAALCIVAFCVARKMQRRLDLSRVRR